MDLVTYIDSTLACASKDELDELLVSTFKTLGATAVSGYAFPYGGDYSTDRTPIISTWPAAVKLAYRTQLAGEDPIMYAAMTTGMPVHFLQIEDTLELKDEATRVLDVMRAHGFRDGVTTPVYAKPGCFAYFVAAFEEERPDLTNADLRFIKVLFTEYFCRYRELKTTRSNMLSKRERQVLVAMVNGMSNTQIADMMGVSEHTVGTYVRRCFEKLEVHSRNQAVLHFLGAGALDIPA
ncbi:MAG: LuxR C-terminal-related transcriptional regulator [Henriciella sp.]